MGLKEGGFCTDVIYFPTNLIALTRPYNDIYYLESSKIKRFVETYPTLREPLRGTGTTSATRWNVSTTTGEKGL